MNKLNLLIVLLLSCSLWSQNHKEYVDTIQSIESAESYAKRYSDVFVSRVTYDRDQMLFDNVDTSNMEAHIGETVSFFGRNTKFLEDTTFKMVELQTITFNFSSVDKSTAELLANQMIKRMDKGETYWDVRQKYSHTSAIFTSRPEYVDEMESRLNISFDDAQENSYMRLNMENSIIIVIVKKVPYLSPSFITVSYNSLNR